MTDSVPQARRQPEGLPAGQAGPARTLRVDGLAAPVDDSVVLRRQWVIIGVAAVVAAGLVVAAVVFGSRGVEVASWLAGVASLVVAVAAVVLARSGSPAPAAGGDRTVSSPGGRSVGAGGDVSGIVSTGDHTTNTQQR